MLLLIRIMSKCVSIALVASNVEKMSVCSAGEKLRHQNMQKAYSSRILKLLVMYRIVPIVLSTESMTHTSVFLEIRQQCSDTRLLETNPRIRLMSLDETIVSGKTKRSVAVGQC